VAKKRRSRITLTGALLIAAAVALLILTIGPTRDYFRQRAEMETLNRELQSIMQENENLKVETERLNTDAYIEQQARLRLGLIRPGEEAYLVVPPKQVPPVKDETVKPKKAASPAKKRSWWQTVVDYFEALCAG